MVRFIVAVLILISSLATPALAADGDRRTFIIKQFKLENGSTLPEAKVMYATYGSLSAAHDNAVLLHARHEHDRPKIWKAVS